MTTLEMMNEAERTGKTYRVGDMLYSNNLGFHDRYGNKWYGKAFRYLNDLFIVNNWQEAPTIYMTKSEMEKKYNIKIVED